jgi:hypothetical protein
LRESLSNEEHSVFAYPASANDKQRSETPSSFRYYKERKIRQHEQQENEKFGLLEGDYARHCRSLAVLPETTKDRSPFKMERKFFFFGLCFFTTF